MGNGVPVPNRWTVYFYVDKGKSENQMDDDWGLALFQDTPVAIQITVMSLLRHRDLTIKHGRSNVNPGIINT